MLSESVIWNVSYQMVANISRFFMHVHTFAACVLASPPRVPHTHIHTQSSGCIANMDIYLLHFIDIDRASYAFHWINCIIFSTFLFFMLISISLSHRVGELERIALVNSCRFQFHFTASNCIVNEFICYICSAQSHLFQVVVAAARRQFNWVWSEREFVFRIHFHSRLLSSWNSIPA